MSGEGLVTFSNKMATKEEVIELISAGEYLVISGDEAVLDGLPSGNWIAGTIPYFMAHDGGRVDQTMLHVNIISGFAASARPHLTLYDVNSVSRIATEAPEHGFTILLLPGESEVHTEYAQNAPDYANMYFSPIIGWVSGFPIDEIGERTAKVGFGPASGMLSNNHAVAIHVQLPEEQTAQIKTVNLFEQGDGPAITFKQTGFEVTSCEVNGQSWNFAEYVTENHIDVRWPLVADYAGVLVNVAILDVSREDAKFYAPVFPDIEYKFAKPVDDYIAKFDKALSQADMSNIGFSCNSLLNLLYCDLEGKKTGDITGPMAFGEIAYQNLTQTLVYLTLDTL
ncbi:DUF6976 family protein [Sessilibacter corallicola]|uniref:Uncharacterized protein n=1 Tax=Sessilibacter corallicola TaxID=2904075 RepID=A0ABQ0A596_9GAMM|nr:hypothetical protein [Sessilibacter corallicola]MCE2027608.1 hypothetical protein [Sessilibacter corallicola]